MPFRSSIIVLSLALTASFSLLGAGEALAQTGPPPTYDYNALTPGTQPPNSTLMQGPLQGYESRVFRTFQLNVPVSVPLWELQAILPPGFTAIANPAGSETASITLALIYHQRGERSGGIDGPVSTLAVTTTVFNSWLQRNETALLANEQSESNSVVNGNELFGAGTVRLAQVETEIEEKSGLLYFRFDVTDRDIGLRLSLQAVGPAAIVARITQDPLGTPFRAFSGTTAQKSFRGANQFDNNGVTVTKDNLRVHAPRHRLRLPGGDVTMVQVGPTMTFQRWRETFFKLEPEQ